MPDLKPFDMKPTIILIALTFLLNTSYGQNELPLWKGEIPFNKKGIYVEEVNDNNRITKQLRPIRQKQPSL